jgi:rubredoxin
MIPGKEIRLDLAPGTAFGDLAVDWQCPVCFAGKDKFVRVG